MKKLAIIFLLLSWTVCGQNATQRFRFTTDYYFLSVKGDVGQHERITGTYARNFASGKATWSGVTIATGKGLASPLGAAEKRLAMEGFSYPLGAANLTDSAFFKTAPEMAMQEQNLVWDSRMFEIFAEEHFNELKPNEAFHIGTANIPLADLGLFQNKDPQLTWIGTTKCGEDNCAVIVYQAFFNTLELRMRTETLVGRSHYWGEIWVSTSTKRLARATLYEDVLGEISMPGSSQRQVVNVFRTGLFEPIKD
jgi:hypothetical protein